MLQPPQNLIFEIPGRRSGCPMQCKHCIHQNVQSSGQTELTPEEIINIIEQGCDYGIKYLNIYPHFDDISIAPPSTIEYLKLGQRLGYKIKTVTNGANPAGIERILPYLTRLAISVDSLDQAEYGLLRDERFHSAVLETLKLLKAYRQQVPLYINALVIVNKKTIGTIEKRVAALYQLRMFDKIQIQEMLPIGGAAHLKDAALTSATDLVPLVRLEKEYRHKIAFATPLWRIKNQKRGCQLGFKDLVIGPQGQLAGCSLLFCVNHVVGNIREYESVAQAWETAFQIFREKALRPVAADCRQCAFYQYDLCWGGCLARMLIFGPEMEIKRSCGMQNGIDSWQQFEKYDQMPEKPGSFLACDFNYD